MQLHHRRADPVRGLDLAGSAAMKIDTRQPASRRGAMKWASRFSSRATSSPPSVVLLLALFGHDADRVRPVAQRDRLHLFGVAAISKFSGTSAPPSALDIGVRDMPAVLAQMRGDAVGAGLFGQFGGAHRIGIGAAARIPHGGHVVDVHAQAQATTKWNPKSGVKLAKTPAPMPRATLCGGSGRRRSRCQT
jgi:hypothetical protein